MLRLHVSGSDRGEQELLLPGPVVRIGRAADNDVVVPDARISSHHARLVRRGETWHFEDLGSRNGSLVERGEVRTTAVASLPLPVAAGDRLLLGDLVSPVAILLAAAPAAEARREDGSGTIVARRAICSGSDALQQVDAPTLRALFRLLHDLSGRSEPSEVMARIADALLDRYADLRAVTVLLRDSRGTLIPEFVRSCEEPCPGPGVSTPARPEGLPEQGMLEQAVRQGEVLVYLTETDTKGHDGPAAPGSGARGRGALVPLTSAAETIGVIHLLRSRQSFGLDDAAWLSIVGLHMAAALARARRFRSLQRAEAVLREENASLRAAAALPRPIIGRSEALLARLSQLRKVAASNTTVLLLGETGTGKELAARYLHACSNRADKAFLPLSCAALPAQLLESELFGHRKGSFTGALRDRPGIFEAARGGTVFLDEIGEVPFELQVKLLRVVQEHEVLPVGGTQPVTVDVRLVAATNRDLLAEVEAGRFRRDLYYRLSVFPIELPPLRSRPGDIDILAEHFRETFCARHGKWVPGFSVEALEVLRRHPWPGNVRELEHVVERAVILTDDGEPIRAGQLSVAEAPGADPAGEPDSGELPRGRLKEVLELLEERLVRRTLAECGDNRTQAAAELGISRQALQVKLARWGMVRSRGEA